MKFKSSAAVQTQIPQPRPIARPGAQAPWKGMSPEKVLETYRKNQEIARSFDDIARSILSVLNIKDFLEKLLMEIKKKRDVPYIWITVADEGEMGQMIREAASNDVLASRTHFVTRQQFISLVKNGTPILANKNLSAYASLMPPKLKDRIRSLAISPLTLDGELLGSLNCASPEDTRYSPDKDPILFQKLATIVSICLSNVHAHEKLDRLATTDPLTGLLNRRVLERVLEREKDRTSRYGSPLTIIFIDLDYFKPINDTYGHKTGDEFLKHITCNISRLLRSTDIAARFAGDEFVCVLPGSSHKDGQDLVKKMRDHFSNTPYMHGDARLDVQFSCGVVQADNTRHPDVKALLTDADACMYEDKKSRKAQRT